MVQSIKHLYGLKLGASDGEIGDVKDFYFDDQCWAVRYIIADTGSWLPGRQVLISPHACGSLQQAGQLLLVNLTRRQIEDSPSIESHKTVSRQYEEEYYRHYGWPYYWQGGGLWGIAGFPIVQLPAQPRPRQPATASAPPLERGDVHLRSTQAVHGYQIKASEGRIGHLGDFLIDVQSWAIRQLVVETGQLLAAGEVTLSTSAVSRISYEESTVFVNGKGAAVGPDCAHQLVAGDAAA